MVVVSASLAGVQEPVVGPQLSVISRSQSIAPDLNSAVIRMTFNAEGLQVTNLGFQISDLRVQVTIQELSDLDFQLSAFRLSAFLLHADHRL